MGKEGDLLRLVSGIPRFSPHSSFYSHAWVARKKVLRGGGAWNFSCPLLYPQLTSVPGMSLTDTCCMDE